MIYLLPVLFAIVIDISIEVADPVYEVSAGMLLFTPAFVGFFHCESFLVTHYKSHLQTIPARSLSPKPGNLFSTPPT